MESLTGEQRAEIDAMILAKDIIPGMSHVMKACKIGLVAARDLFKGRYRQLRSERNAEFACDDEEYWSCYSEDIIEMISKAW
jgi:hypothetical protein